MSRGGRVERQFDDFELPVVFGVFHDGKEISEVILDSRYVNFVEDHYVHVVRAVAVAIESLQEFCFMVRRGKIVEVAKQ